ncbi:MAG: DNA-directed RNA polymerase subunit beta [Cyanobacteria bacterium SBLK]|nr:DNA-directed RNA polymerase subunit beta [Cyanobacteria bacterium SBLK]
MAFFFNVQTSEARADRSKPKEGDLINVLAVIDTAYFTNFSNPSTDPDNPTTCYNPYNPADHCSSWRHHVFLVANDPRGIYSSSADTPDDNYQGTARLNLIANVNDRVSFQGTSASLNSKDTAIVYGITPYRGDVFDPFTIQPFTQTNAVALTNPIEIVKNGDKTLNITKSTQHFAPLVATVKQKGTELYWIDFAVYKLADDDRTQNLYGYFRWEPDITVQ